MRESSLISILCFGSVFLLDCIFAQPSPAVPSVSLVQERSNQSASTANFNLAVSLLTSHQFEKAELAFKEILAQNKRRDNRFVADVLNYIGAALHAQNKEQEAEKFFLDAIAKLPPVSEKDKLMKAKVLSNLAGVYLALGKTAQCSDCCEKSANLFREVGNSSKDLAVLLNSHARLKMYMRDWSAAESLLDESIKLRECALGKNSIELTSPLVNLGTVYLEQEKFQQAEQVYERTIAICEKSNGTDCDLLFALVSNLAESQLELKKTIASVSNYKRALSISDKEFGTHSIETLNTLLSLSEAAEASNQRPLATESLKRAVDICRTNFGPQDERTLQALEALADLEGGNGNGSEARRLRFLSRISRKR